MLTFVWLRKTENGKFHVLISLAGKKVKRFSSPGGWKWTWDFFVHDHPDMLVLCSCLATIEGSLLVHPPERSFHANTSFVHCHKSMTCGVLKGKYGQLINFSWETPIHFRSSRSKNGTGEKGTLVYFTQRWLILYLEINWWKNLVLVLDAFFYLFSWSSDGRGKSDASLSLFFSLSARSWMLRGKMFFQ